jgi:hypothetical protein
MGLVRFIRSKVRRAPKKRPARRVAVHEGNWYRWRIKVKGVPTDEEAKAVLRGGYAGSSVKQLRVVREGDPMVFEYTSFQLGDGDITLGAWKDISGLSAPNAREAVVAVWHVPKPR